MKTPRIDHAARSRRRMEETLSSHETGEDAGAIVVAVAALNDATLALVEQQRIANLIALAEGSSPYQGVAGYTLGHPDIVAALGIGAAS